MRTPEKCTVSLVCLLSFILVFVITPDAFARYEDRSDELPGMDSGVTTLLIVGTALIGAVLLIKLAKSDDSPDLSPEPTSPASESDVEQEKEDSGPDLFETSTMARAYQQPDRSTETTWRPVCGVGRDGAVAGVSVSF